MNRREKRKNHKKRNRKKEKTMAEMTLPGIDELLADVERTTKAAEQIKAEVAAPPTPSEPSGTPSGHIQSFDIEMRQALKARFYLIQRIQLAASALNQVAAALNSPGELQDGTVDLEVNVPVLRTWLDTTIKTMPDLGKALGEVKAMLESQPAK